MSLVMQTENGRCSCWLDSQRIKETIEKEKTEKNSRINHNIEQNIILQILRSA